MFVRVLTGVWSDRRGHGPGMDRDPDTTVPPARPLPTETPYRGLEPFQVEHARCFFGRTQLTQTLVRQFWAIAVGPSGSAMSSVLRPGLMAALCGDSAEGRWPRRKV
jgi:hypothetical protein